MIYIYIPYNDVEYYSTIKKKQGNPTTTRVASEGIMRNEMSDRKRQIL